MYSEYPALIQKLKTMSLGDYLEFGCGDGMFLNFVLKNNVTSTSITAIDINPLAVEKARENLVDFDVHFFVGDKIPLPFKAQQFTTITISNTLHHLQDKQSVFKELIRLAKPAGQIIITEMISNELDEAERVYCDFHALRAETDRLRGVYHDRTYSSQEILKLIGQTGLRIEEQEVILNDKSVIMDEEEIRGMESNIDELIQGAINTPEYENLADQADHIKNRLRQFGIKRPRQLYVKATV